MHRIPCEKLTVFSKNYHCECGYLPGWSSSVFKYNPVLPNRLEIDPEL